MLNKTRKLEIEGIEYNFKIINRTILKIDEEYGNYSTILEGIMKGKQFYINALKVLSCACIGKEWGVEELADALTSEQMTFEIPNLVTSLYFDYMGVGEDTKKEDKKESKNKKN